EPAPVCSRYSAPWDSPELNSGGTVQFVPAVKFSELSYLQFTTLAPAAAALAAPALGAALLPVAAAVVSSARVTPPAGVNTNALRNFQVTAVLNVTVGVRLPPAVAIEYQIVAQSFTLGCFSTARPSWYVFPPVSAAETVATALSQPIHNAIASPIETAMGL